MASVINSPRRPHSALLSTALCLLTLQGPAPAEVLLDQSFASGNGGFVPSFTAADGVSEPTGAWTFDASLGSWFADGDDSLAVSTGNDLTSPALPAPAAFLYRVTFSHRYSFEAEWDGGVLQYSLNEGPWVTVPKTAFRKNGYTFNSLIGGHTLQGQAAFNGNSPGYAVPEHITSEADLPGLGAPGTLKVRLAGAWDEYTRGALPNWEVRTVRVESAGDQDGDGMDDAWETANGLNPDVADANQDADADGLLNLAEYTGHADPQKPDTDGDGLRDGVESGGGTFVNAADTGTDRLVADTDGDGLTDGVETGTGVFAGLQNTGSNPLLRDTDNDQVSDFLEATYGSNPSDPASSGGPPGVPALLAFWDFNDTAAPEGAKDLRIKAQGVFAQGAAYTEDMLGRTGQAGDHALLLGGGGARMEVANAGAFLNIGTRADKLTIAFWQRLNEPNFSSSFWMFSPSSPDTQRGAQAHVPYGTGNQIYFDTGGAAGASQRVNVAAPSGFDWTVWHHIVLVKNRNRKEIWVDGVLLNSNTATAPFHTDFTDLRVGCDTGSSSINGELDDFAVFASALSKTDIARLAAGASPMSLTDGADTDADTLPDSWETLYFAGDLTKLTATGDHDADGVSDAEEMRRDMAPNLKDTDGDGLPDGVETGTGIWVSAAATGSNPLLADTDGDGLADAVETNSGIYQNIANPGTHPNRKDTDGDSFPDALEILYKTDPTKSGSRPYNPAGPALIAWWNFDEPLGNDGTADKVNQLTGLLQSGASLTDPGEGVTAGPADRALKIAAGSQQMLISDGKFMSLGAVGNALSVSLWQKLDSVAYSSAFFAYSPTAGSGNRGFQAHTPWAGNNFATLDSSGCCANRAEAVLPEGFDTSVWHHYVFIKSGNIQQIWLNGSLLATGASNTPFPDNFTSVAVGRGDSGSINGSIDDFAVYAGGLTEAQVKALWEGAAPDSILSAVPPAGAPFLITALIRNADQSLDLTWESVPGTVYAVQGSANLVDWTPLQSGVAASAQGGTTTLRLPAAPASPFFLRVIRP